MRKLPGLVLIAGLAACQDITRPVTPEPEQARVQNSMAAAMGGPQLIPGRFIVTLTEKARADEVVRDHGIAPDFVYGNVLNGFAGSISDAARSGLMRDMRVVRIDPDELVFADGGVQPGATWGIDRADQRALPLSGSYAYDYTGAGVTAYILDTGVRYTHQDFGGRAGPGYDAYGGDGSDCHGHGTHVASTVAGAVYGVAKQARVVSVRVLSCTGSGATSGVIAGMDWVAANAKRPAVVNMSLGGGINYNIDAAVDRLVASGVTTVVAAGNSSADACQSSPARAPKAITVGATDRTDTRASFSNFGTCVDIFAPGVSITAAAYSGDAATTSKSGTSMASPHVAGAAALVLEENPGASPAQVAATLSGRATQSIVKNAQSAANHLLYTLGGGTTVAPPATTNLAPSAAFQFSCSALSCAFTDKSADSDGSVASWSWSFGDGGTSSLQHPARTFASAGTYSVTLTVKDNAGASATVTHAVTVQAPAPNALPVASFNVSCTNLICSFNDLSSDVDGTIAQRSWSFGDGTSSSQSVTSNISHSYNAAGSYQVKLTVTDDRGGVSSATQTVSVSGIALSATGFKEKGRHRVDLSWSGAGTTAVDIVLNGQQHARVPNNGAYSFSNSAKGSATYDFKVCEVGTTRCSAVVSVRL